MSLSIGSPMGMVLLSVILVSDDLCHAKSLETFLFYELD